MLLLFWEWVCSENMVVKKNSDGNVKFSVAFILLREFTLFAFSGFVDALRIAGDEADNSRQNECCWTVIAPTLRPIRANCGVEVIPWEVFPDPTSFDYLVVIGGRVGPQRDIDPRITDYLHLVARQGGTIIGVCTASFVLARAGLMKERKSCIHWHHLSEFEEEFPGLEASSDMVFIEDGKRITCPGGRSAADVALYLIEKHCGASRARKAASGMVMEGVRGSQTPQPHAEISWLDEVDNPLVRRAIVLMDRHVTHPITMKEIADRLHISENSLYRSFSQVMALSPARLLRVMRLAHGHWSLHHTALTIAQIAHSYQFSDASHFTRLHRQYYGTTPVKARGGGEEKCREKLDKLYSGNMTGRILSGALFVFSHEYNL